MPVAVPVTWVELEDIPSSDGFSIAAVEIILERARSRELKNWGVASQLLPTFR